MRILELCLNYIPRSKQSLVWILCGSAVSMATLALAIKAYNYSKGTRSRKTTIMKQNNFNGGSSSYDTTTRETDNEIEGCGMSANTKFLVDQLIISASTDDKLIIPLLVTLSERLDVEPHSNHFNDVFIQALSNMCNSSNIKIRENALIAAHFLCRSPRAAQFKRLLNVIFARLRFARYMLEFTELELVLKCLCNASLCVGTGAYFVPSLEIIGELVSHQDESKLSHAQLSAWLLLVNLSKIPLLIPHLMNMPWQWMLAIKCNKDCETSRLLFFSNLLNHFPIYLDVMRKIKSGSLIAALTSPLTYSRLKESFKPSQPDVNHTKASESFLANLEKAFNAYDGPRRIDELKKSTKRFPEESHQYSSLTLVRNWNDADLRNACKKLCHWYNNLAVRCDFRIHDSLPYRVKFVEHTGIHLDVDFIGEPTSNWTVHPIFEENTSEIDFVARDLNSNFFVERCNLPSEILGPELENKTTYSSLEEMKVKNRMDLILDELAIICAPFYSDVMRIRDLPYLNSIMDYRPDGIHAMLKENVFMFNDFALPLAESIVPHRPFIFDIDESSDLNIDECVRKFVSRVDRISSTNATASENSKENRHEEKTIHYETSDASENNSAESNLTSHLLKNSLYHIDQHIKRCFENHNLNIRTNDGNTSIDADVLSKKSVDGLGQMNVSDEIYCENEEPYTIEDFANEYDKEAENFYDYNSLVDFVKVGENHQWVVDNSTDPISTNMYEFTNASLDNAILARSHASRDSELHFDNKINKNLEHTPFVDHFDSHTKKETTSNEALSNTVDDHEQNDCTQNGLDELEFIKKISKDTVAKIFSNISQNIDNYVASNSDCSTLSISSSTTTDNNILSTKDGYDTLSTGSGDAKLPTSPKK
ncbi:hypothetical protein GJ496_011341 [Pomphorhynchus laevis]|nr:hypothetical protein GJ496_011341 [Pomphorhynchus laevis]